jgi:hypothetical protein
VSRLRAEHLQNKQKKIGQAHALRASSFMKMNNNTAKVKKQIVKILGYSVTVGSKKHALLVWQQKHFNDLANN